MPKPKERLTKIPTRKEPKPAKKPAKPEATEVDLDYIAPQLRPLARPIGEIEFLPNNPRLHGEENIAQITASLKQFGQYAPVVVNKRHSPPVVIAGNGRLRGALSLSWPFIAVVELDVDDATANAIAIADNRTSETSEWSPVELEAMLREVGVTDAALTQMLADLAEAEKLIPKEGGDKPKDETTATAVTTVTITCPSDRYGEIGMAVEHIKSVPGVTVKVTEKGKEESTAT